MELSTRARPTPRAAMLAALLVVAVALLSGGVSGAQTSAGALSKKINKLTKKVAQLQTQVAVLQLEQGKPRPPSGSAGGDLTGNYPNPQIPLIGPDQIATGAVRADEIETDAVGSTELSDIVLVENSVSIASGGSNFVNAFCPSGADIISGSAWWDFQSGSISASRRFESISGVGWRAEGENEGMATQLLHVQALCLPPGI